MTPLVPTPGLRQVALADPWHFHAHVTTYGTADDLAVVRAAVPSRALRAGLDDAPPGFFDAWSWAYWHLVLAGRSPPPLPERLCLSGLA